MQRLPLLLILFLVAGLMAWNVGYYTPDALSDVEGSDDEGLPAPAVEDVPGVVALAMGVGFAGTLDPSFEDGVHEPGPLVDESLEVPDCFEDLEVVTAEPGQEQDVPILHEDGSLRAEVHTKDGLLDGPWIEYTPEGQKISEGQFIEGARAGRWVFWRPDGSKRAEGRYAAGVKQGPWTSWHENALPEREVFYEAGDPDGMYREWYTNGQVRAAGLFILGRREGYWEFYDYDGSLDVRTGNYLSGKRVR